MPSDKPSERFMYDVRITVKCVYDVCKLDTSNNYCDPYVKVQLNGIEIGKLRQK